MKNIFTIVIVALLFSSFQVVARTETVSFPFSFRVSDEDSKQSLSEYSINVFENDLQVKTIRTGSDGVVKYNFKKDVEYKLVFTSNNSYIEKVIVVDTRNIELSKWKYKDDTNVSLGYDVDVRLFKPTFARCQNFNFLKTTPVMELRYNAKRHNLYDYSDNDVLTMIKKERKKNCRTIIKRTEAIF